MKITFEITENELIFHNLLFKMQVKVLLLILLQFGVHNEQN